MKTTLTTFYGGQHARRPKSAAREYACRETIRLGERKARTAKRIHRPKVAAERRSLPKAVARVVPQGPVRSARKKLFQLFPCCFHANL